MYKNHFALYFLESLSFPKFASGAWYTQYVTDWESMLTSCMVWDCYDVTDKGFNEVITITDVKGSLLEYCAKGIKATTVIV